MQRIKPQFAAVIFLAALSGSATTGPRTPVVLVTIDTLRADRVGRAPESITPFIDALARDGVRFSRPSVQVPITLPSHVSIMTATYPMYHGVRDFGGMRLKEERETLAEILKTNGYLTAAFVSSFALDSQWGLDQGFDLYHDSFDLSGYAGIGFNAVERKGDETTALALDWLKKNKSKPFFLWVHLFDPHDPYEPPEPYRSRFLKQPYDGEVAFADAQSGRLLQALKQEKLYDPALIVVVGDHGEGLGEHEEETHGFFIYNTTLRVPLIVKLPGNLHRGKVIDSLVESVDIAPTVLQVLRLPRGGEMQGRGLLGLFTNERVDKSGAAYAESYYARYHFGWGSLLSYQDGRYKYIRAPRRELYDLLEDPQERVNLYDRVSALGNQYDAQLSQMMGKFKRVGAARAQEPAVDEATRQRLQSLGYIAISAGREGSDENQGRADPKDKIILFNTIRRATLETEKGDYSASMVRLVDVLKQDPEIYTARYLQGYNYFQTAQFAKAVDEFKASLKLFPDSSLATHSLAMSYFNLGMLEAAEAGFQRLVELEPGNPQGHVGLGSVCLKRRKLDCAESTYRRAVALGDSREARLGLGRTLVANHNLDAGIEQFQAVLQRYPRSSEAHFLLGYTYQQKGMAEQARRHFQLAKELEKH